MLEDNIVVAHTTLYLDFRPCQFIVVVLVATCKGDLLKFLFVIKPTIMRTIGSFPRNVAFLGIIGFEFPRTNRTLTHAFSPLPKTISVSPNKDLRVD